MQPLVVPTCPYATKLRLVRKVQMLGADVSGTGGVLKVR